MVLVILSIVCGIICSVSAPLSKFLLQVGKDECNTCKQKSDCLGKKILRKKQQSDWLNEWMLLSFLKVKRTCPRVEIIKIKNQILFTLCNCMIWLFFNLFSEESNILLVNFVVITVLLSISVVDWNTQYIPMEFNVILFICGLIHLYADYSNWLEYVIGLFAVSGFLLLVDKIGTPILRKKYGEDSEINSVVGDGDIKLMAATGLLLGWKLNFLALGIGCILGSVIQLIIMKIKESDRQFALGPYLSLGIYITMICGERLVSWYLNMMGIGPIK